MFATPVMFVPKSVFVKHKAVAILVGLLPLLHLFVATYLWRVMHAGISGTLHRISCLRNKSREIVGLTCRFGRAIEGGLAAWYRLPCDMDMQSAAKLVKYM